MLFLRVQRGAALMSIRVPTSQPSSFNLQVHFLLFLSSMAYLFRALRTASSFPTQHSVALRINPARLNLTLHDTCQWGEAMRYGP